MIRFINEVNIEDYFNDARLESKFAGDNRVKSVYGYFLFAEENEQSLINDYPALQEVIEEGCLTDIERVLSNYFESGYGETQVTNQISIDNSVLLDHALDFFNDFQYELAAMKDPEKVFFEQINVIISHHASMYISDLIRSLNGTEKYFFESDFLPDEYKK